MKLRLLNGSHLAVAALGRLMGCTWVHEAMAAPHLAAYMAALMAREVAPALPLAFLGAADGPAADFGFRAPPSMTPPVSTVVLPPS